MTFDELRVTDPEYRSTVIGRTGTGKSFLARAIMPRDRRLAILDPKCMFDYPDTCEAFDNPSRLIKRKPERFCYRPTLEFYDDTDAWNDVLAHVFNQRDTYLYIDDMVGILDKGMNSIKALKDCYLMGRARHVTIQGVVQRPSGVPLYMFTESTQFYAFKLKLEKDIKRVESWIPGYDPSQLGKYEFFYYDDATMEAARIVKLEQT